MAYSLGNMCAIFFVKINYRLWFFFYVSLSSETKQTTVCGHRQLRAYRTLVRWRHAGVRTSALRQHPPPQPSRRSSNVFSVSMHGCPQTDCGWMLRKRSYCGSVQDNNSTSFQLQRCPSFYDTVEPRRPHRRSAEHGQSRCFALPVVLFSAASTSPGPVVT